MLRLNRPMVAALFAAGFPMMATAADIIRPARPIRREIKGNLTLDEAVRIAVRQNPNVLKQIAEIERTRGLIIEATAQALPHLVLNSSYEQQDKRLIEDQNFGQTQKVPDILIPLGPGPNAQTFNLADLFNAQSGQDTKSPDKTWQVSFEVQQLIYSGGQVIAAIHAAKFTEDSAYWQLRDIIDQVIATTRTQFYTVLTNRSLITVAEETVKLQQDLLKDQTNRFEAGTVPRFNVLRAEVELANVIPTLIRAKNDYLISEINLAKTLGLDPGPSGRPTFTPVGALSVIDQPLSLVDALNIAKARRPFLKVQRQQIKIQAENIKIALAGYQPTIDGHAGYLFRNSRLTDDIEDVVDGWFFGFTGTWNIFDGGATYGRVKQARAQLESAKVTYDDSVQQVVLEVQQAYANLVTQRETIRSQQKNVEQATEALRLANERLAAGAGTQLEVLDARVALTRAQSTEVLARGDYNIAMAELNRSTAVDTIYNESFKDPLMKIEQRIFGKKAVQKTEVKKTEVKKAVVKRDAEPKKVVPVKSTATPAPKKKAQ
jgi:outer membrane protein TolC